MKNVYTLLLAFGLTLSLSAEEIINEPFSTWLPEGWSVIEGSGSPYYSHWFHREEQFATVYVTGDNQDEWLITPEFTLPTIGELKLSVDMMGSYYRMVTMDWGDFYVYVSMDDGENWELLWKEDDQEMVEASAVDWPYGNNEWFFPSISLNAYAGETMKIAFRYVSPDGDADWWNLDNVNVKSLLENEVVLQSFDFPEYGLIDDEFSFAGTFKNYGTYDVTSFEAIYSVNGVESDPFLVEGINVAYNTSYDFTHDIPFTFTDAEIYELDLRISQVNGSADPIPENNILFRDISIATGFVTRKPLFEVFTSSSCPACPSTNEAVDAVLANNPGAYSLVKYQVYWPGVGDPYYIIDDSIRAEYYNVGGVPDVYSNGVFEQGYNFNQSDFNAATNEGAYTTLDMSYTFNGTNVTVDLSLTPSINILDAAVHIAVVEKVTYYNVGNNGETEFHNVLMKMLPGPYGTSISLEEGVTVNITESANLLETFIEEYDDLEVIAWVQDNETRYVLQSASSNLMVGAEEHENNLFGIFPNPAKNILYVDNLASGVLSLCDINGKRIREINFEPGLTTISIADLPKGVYILKTLTDDQKAATFKMVKD